MTSAGLASPATAADDRYRALLAVSAAIIAHRDLSALFRELASRLRQVVHFDHLGLVSTTELIRRVRDLKGGDEHVSR
jgi:hypothetical protein